MKASVRLQFRNGQVAVVHGKYHANGKRVELWSRIEEGQTARQALEAQQAEAEQKLGVTPV